jgi:hypothetical protein
MDYSLLVTIHARVRFVERALGKPIGRLAAEAGIDRTRDADVWRWAVRTGLVDAGAVEAVLVTPTTIGAIRAGAKSIDMGNGFRAMIRDGHIITVLDKQLIALWHEKLHRTREPHVQRRRAASFKQRKHRERVHDYF